MKRSLLIAGATGLVGSAVTDLAAADPRFGPVITWGRRPVPDAPGTVEHWGPGPDGLVAGLGSDRVNAVICCLGTTMRNVKGDKQAFLHVDQDLVLALARWSSGTHARFCLVSALGADPSSMFFYNRVKGNVERELTQLEFAALHIFRPSILDGPRQESRPGERIGLAAMKILAPMLPVASRPMPYRTLAQALLNAAAGDDHGIHIHTTKGIEALVR